MYLAYLPYKFVFCLSIIASLYDLLNDSRVDHSEAKDRVIRLQMAGVHLDLLEGVHALLPLIALG